MLKKRKAEFHELVWRTASRVGSSAPRITNEILEIAFPATVRCARDEGADKMLRNGVIFEVKRIIKAAENEETETAFMDFIDPAYRECVAELKSRKYFVEHLDEHVDILTLINDLPLLDDARKYMRKKGLENIAEANRLDELYFAVTAGAAA